jgi:hypothetical protein
MDQDITVMADENGKIGFFIRKSAVEVIRDCSGDGYDTPMCIIHTAGGHEFRFPKGVEDMALHVFDLGDQIDAFKAKFKAQQ